MTAQLEDFGWQGETWRFWEKVATNDDYTVCNTCGEDWLTGGCSCLINYMTGKVDSINEFSKQINQEA